MVNHPAPAARHRAPGGLGAVLVFFLAAVLTFATTAGNASAAAWSTDQNRVKAPAPVSILCVGPSQHIAAGQHPDRGPPQQDLAQGRGVHTYYVLAGTTPVLVHNDNGPSGTVARQGDMSIQIYGNDHGPAHAHLKVGGRDIQIGQNGKPLEGEPELNAKERQFVKDNLSDLRQALKKKMAQYRLNCE